jgi:DNA ligase-1
MKPMLAVEAPAKLVFPLYASPKLDGVRCVVSGAQALSRTLKPIPNKHVQQYLGDPILEGLDGELIVGVPYAEDVYRATSSGVMSQDGTPDFKFYVFDYHNDPDTARVYKERLERLTAGLRSLVYLERVVLLEQRYIETEDQLLAYEAELLAQGYEGVMLRAPKGIYKHGRSTAREGYLLKLKRFSDGEARITGFEELMHNANEAQLDELGHTKRSSHQENLVPMDTLGALQVEDLETGIAFKIGTGYTATHRKHIWQQRDRLVGAIVKYKHFEIGVKDAPRFPVWLGFRDAIDM